MDIDPSSAGVSSSEGKMDIDPSPPAGISSSEGKTAAANDQVDIQPHVLVVDDDRTSRLIHTAIFMYYSCKVTAAGSGSQAMELLGLVDDKDNSANDTHIIPKVNLICSDYHMTPDMNGYELLKKIKESSATKDVPVVIVSSDVEADRVNECLEAGAKMFVSKPLKSTDVESMMKLMNNQGR